MAAGRKHSAAAGMAATLKGGGAASTAHPTVGEKHHLPDTPPAGSKPRFPHGAVSVAHLTVEEHPPLDEARIYGSKPSQPQPPNTATETPHDRRRADQDTFLADAAEARRVRLRREARDTAHEAASGVTKPSPAEVVRRILTSPKAQPICAPAGTSSSGNVTHYGAEARGDKRNVKRLRESDAADRTTLGESPRLARSRAIAFLPGDAALFFPAPISGPIDESTPPPWFIDAIRAICGKQSPTPSKSPIRFELSDQASAHNAALLTSVDCDLRRLVKAHSKSTLGFGSEFRGVGELRPLLSRHPHFPQLVKLLTEGMPYIFTRELSSKEREAEVEGMLARGNHKSAQQEQEIVGKLLAKDVLHGFTIPLPAEFVSRIPGAMVQPLGLVQQWTVDSEGKRQIKYRLTQDLSFSLDHRAEPRSVNSRVDMSAYAEMVYGWCLPRIIHYIVSLRGQNPGMRILISKYDYSDAYRRIAHSPEAATQTIAINGSTAYLALRLTFGGCPNPPSFTLFSEVVTDLANEISQCDEWDPDELRSPAQPITPEPRRLSPEIPIAQARTMAVAIPPTKAGGRVDGFIDDLINVFLDTPENCRRQPHVVPLAMHLTSRPHAGDADEPVPRRPILSIPKLEAEGRPEEIQIVLGWRLNTRSLEASLPDDKFRAWSIDIASLLVKKACTMKELETLVGRLNHAAYVLPNARHFLSRIRRGLSLGGGNKRNRALDPEALEDLILWEGFLSHAHNGVPMNLLVTREPNKVCWSDACPYGLGGYSVSGRAWRLQIPLTSPIFGHKGINNLLEFLGMAINIWLACLESNGDEHCILAIGDNTSAIGWLHNSSRLDSKWEAHNAHLKVARKIAMLLIDSRCCLASQHLKGELNVVADLLSFAGGGAREKVHPIAADMPANDELTRRFLNLYPSQVPVNFAISQLPDDVLSWTTQVLQVAESSLTADKRAVTSHMTEPGEGGQGTARMSDTQLTPASLCYPTTNGTCSSEHSSTSTGQQTGKPMADLQELVATQWSRVLCAKPQATWLRRFGAVSGPAPCTSRDRRTCDPSSDPGSKRATTSIPRNGSSEQRPHNSCELCSSKPGRGTGPSETTPKILLSPR